MIDTRGVGRARARGARLASVAIAITLLATGTGRSWGDDALEARQLVEQATLTVENFQADPKMGAFRDLVKRAQGVFIAPQLLKAAFVVGASGGSGVLMARDEHTGEWHGPAFYTLGGGSLGWQIGADVAEVIVLVMTERGVHAMMQPSVKLGADASLAIGPIGAGIEGATENLSVDLVVFSRAKGLYGGIALQGAVLGVRTARNARYYGKPVKPTDILIRGEANPKAEALLTAIRHVADPKTHAQHQ